MRISSDGKRAFVTDLRRSMHERGLNISQTAKKTGIHQSQVSRMLSGHFQTTGSNVIKICMEFEMEPKNYCVGTHADEDRRQVINSALSIWDGTHGDAELVSALLRDIAKVRKSGARRR